MFCVWRDVWRRLGLLCVSNESEKYRVAQKISHYQESSLNRIKNRHKVNHYEL